MTTKLTLLSATSALLLGSLLTASAQDRESKAVRKDPLLAASRTFTAVAREAIPAVVFIEVEKTGAVAAGPPAQLGSNNPYDLFGDDLLRRFFGDRLPVPPGGGGSRGREFTRRGQGSGFIVDKEGYILSNSHVVGDADEIVVHLHDGRELEAELVGTDPQSEVAVIKVDAGGELPVIPLADSSKLEIGGWVIAIGNPFGLTETLTVGVVSATGRSNIGIANYEDMIQTDAAINPGNSGGPLLNIDGEAVGINTAIYSRSGGYMGIGFAIPSNMAGGIMEQLIEKGKVERGFLGVGIQPVTQDLADAFGLERPRGALVSQVSEGSPAARGGVEQGDVIVELNGTPVKDMGAFRNKIAATPPGKTVRLTVLRDEKRKSLKVKLGTRSSDTALATPSAGDDVGRLGFEVQELTKDLAKRFGYEGDEGVIISQVERGSAAALAGLEPGQLIREVNRRPVAGVDEFNDAIADDDDGETLLLLVTDGEASRFVTLDRE